MHRILWGISKLRDSRFEFKGKHTKHKQDYLFTIWIGPFWLMYSVISAIFFVKHREGEILYGRRDR